MAIGTKVNLAKTKEYFVNEGNKIGYMDTEWSSEFNSSAPHLVAGEALVKGRAVYVYDEDASGNFVIKMCASTSQATKRAIGVAMFDAKNGEECAIETEGLFKMLAGGSISAGDVLTATSASVGGTTQYGVVVAATAAAQDNTSKVVTAGTPICGIALNDATSGGTVYVKFLCAVALA